MEALLKSLVGSSIEYRGSVRTIEDAAFKSRTLRTERDHIRKSLEMGSSLPEDVRLILYTELLGTSRTISRCAAVSFSDVIALRS